MTVRLDAFNFFIGAEKYLLREAAVTYKDCSQLKSNRILFSASRVAHPDPDPVFLHGSGSGFQNSLDPDPVVEFSGSGSGSGFSQDSGKLQKGL